MPGISVTPNSVPESPPYMTATSPLTPTTPPDPEPEVMGNPGRVRDIVALFSSQGNTADCSFNDNNNVGRRSRDTTPRSMEVLNNTPRLRPFSSKSRERALDVTPKSREQSPCFRHVKLRSRDNTPKPWERDALQEYQIHNNNNIKSRDSSPIFRRVKLRSRDNTPKPWERDSLSNHRSTPTSPESRPMVWQAGTPQRILSPDFHGSAGVNGAEPMSPPEPSPEEEEIILTTQEIIQKLNQMNGHLNGSEPSLTSRNGQRSSVTASKRTLVSQDTKSQATHSHSPSDEVSNHSGGIPPNPGGIPTHARGIPPQSATGNPPIATTIITTDLTSDELSQPLLDVDTPTKTPSYMRISCAISGYNKYSSYANTPEQQRDIRVIKSPESDSKNTPLVNGSAGDEVDSSRPLLANGGCGAVSNSRTDGCGAPDKVSPKQCIGGGSVVTCSDLKLSLDESKTSTSDASKTSRNTPSPHKDGHYYLRVLDSEVERITQLCDQAEGYLQQNLPEEASGKVRAAVGKGHLLMAQKFNQFKGLCQKNITPEEGDPFPTTSQDLAGFWDMVSLQVEDVNSMFSEIDKLKSQNWHEDKKSPSRPGPAGEPSTKVTSKSTGAAARSKARVKEGSKSAPATPKSSKNTEAAKAREEARRRLMAAKKAGRQRKASQSDKDEIEIFVQ